MNCCYDCFAEVLFSYADESWSEHEARVMLRFGLGEKNGRLCFPSNLGAQVHNQAQ
jgi:hypothetical protein